MNPDMHNKIRHLREQRGMSQAELASLMSVVKQTISKLENNQMSLTLSWMDRIAAALKVAPTDLIEGTPLDFRGDAASFSPKPGTLADLAVKGGHRALFKMTSRALDQLGINPGDICVVDHSVEAAEDVKTGDIVVAQHYNFDDFSKTHTILRQFVAPSLLITNSELTNPPPINMARIDARIKAVVIGWHHKESSP